MSDETIRHPNLPTREQAEQGLKDGFRPATPPEPKLAGGSLTPLDIARREAPKERVIDSSTR